MSKSKRESLTKRIVAMMLTLVLVLSGFGAIGVEKAHAATPRNGEHSSDEGSTTWKWSLDAEGKLTIEPKTEGGTAYIAYKDGKFPWGNNAEDKELRDAIRTETTSIEIKEGMIGTGSLITFFGYFTNLKTADLTKLNISNVTYTQRLFQMCENLESVDTTGWDFSKVEDADYMFSGCKKLTEIKGIENWKTSSLKTMMNMFYNCESLTSLNLNNWNVANLTRVGYAFGFCTKLETLEVGNWKTGSITIFTHTFMNCSSLKSLDLSGFDSSETTSLYMTFYGCKSLNSITFGDKWDTSNVTNMSNMFTICNALTDFSFMETWDVSSVASTSSMFHGCKGMTELCFGKNSSGAITQTDSMFAYCENLETLDLRFFNGYVSLKDVAALKDLQVGDGFTGGTAPKNMVNISVNPLDPSPYIQKNYSFPKGAGHYVPAKQISFEKKDGEGSMDPLYLAEGVDNVPLRENTFTKDKAIFAGWNTKYNGSGTAFQDKDIVSYANAAFQDGYGSYTLYAQWDADENEDGIEDKYQVFVTYETTDSEKGTITGAAADAPYTAQKVNGLYESTVSFTTVGGRTATPKEGYVFSKWSNSYNESTNSEGKIAFTDVPGGTTIKLTAEFLSKKYYGNITDENNNPITPAADDPITDPTTKPEVGDVIVDEDGNPYEITDIDDANTDPDTGEVPIKVKELTDEDDDGIPDKYQVTVEYVSEGASKGTVAGTTEKFPKTPSTTGKYESKISFTATGATAIANDGYVFSKFVNDVNDATNIDGKFAFTDVDVNKTITITGMFVAKSYAGNITDENNNPITPATDDPITDPTTKPEVGDVVEDENGDLYEITEIDEDNADPDNGEVPIKVKGLTDEDGDGIPDKYQVTVKYESADETMGTVTGATEKFPKEKSSKYTDKISFTATGATPNPKAGYAFVEFVNDKDDKTNTDGKFAFTEIEVQSTIIIKATFIAKDFTNIKDEEGNPITPKNPLPSDPEPKKGDRFLDDNGDPYEITEVGPTDPATGDTPITVKPVPKNYDDVKDEDGNPVTPKPPFNDDDNKPEKGKRFIDENGDPYEITEIGETDPKTGDTPITVKPVPKNYDDVKDEEDNPVKPKEPIGKDGKDPKVGDRFEDENGDEYEITEVGPSDKNGKVPITVGQVMTLSFDLNGGTLEGQTGTYFVKEVKNRSFVIPLSAPTKEGYVFDYWQGSKYYPGQVYVVKDNHKFTAIWKTAEADTSDDDDRDSAGSKNKSAKTGDESNVALWITLMLISCLGAIGSIAYRRRRD